ncbi:MAG: DUF924 family protein [Pseudomonadota bacterium]
MARPEDILSFWLDDLTPQDWYAVDAALDADIKTRFFDTWVAATEGAHSLWLTYPTGVLAYIILTDQFPRNMFRDDAKAFQTDRLGLSAAKSAIERGWDLRIDEPARQFFYLPLMHSENSYDQDRAVRLICERMPKTGESNLLHARAHRQVIREFGRFPYRNEALQRATTKAEAAYLAQGGYGSTVRALQEDAVAA